LINKLFYFVKETFSDAWGIVRSPKEGLTSLYHVSLYRNAVYLMISSAVMGLTGFFFWIAAARLYSADEVGLASAAIAAMMLLSMVAMVGLDYALIRFIPGAGQSTRDIINSSFTIAGITSTILVLLFIAGLSFWAPKLHPILEHPMLFIAFVVSVPATTLFGLAQRVFTAKLRSSFALAMGLLFGFLRFVPLAILAAYSATLGIFAAWGIATFVSLMIGIFFLLPRVEPGYRPSLMIRKDIASPMVRFASANFLANCSLTITGYVLPLVVLNVLGEEQTAYFYVSWSFSQVVFGVMGAVTINLFAEGSHDQARLREYVKKSLKLMTLILIPAVTLTLLLGDKLLLAFGDEYSQNATHLLWLLILACVPAGLNYTYIAVMRVGTQMRGIVAITLFLAILTLGSSPYLLSHMGLTGVGVAWIAGQTVVAVFTGRQILRIYSQA
jgi:O-antigen/teichoic acid export membrane protein